GQIPSLLVNPQLDPGRTVLLFWLLDFYGGYHMAAGLFRKRAGCKHTAIRCTYPVICLVGCDRDGGAQLADRSPGLAWLVHPVLTWTRAQPGDDLLRCDGATWHHGEHPAAGDRLLYVRLWHCTGAV